MKYCILLQRISAKPMGMAFEGPVKRPGELVPDDLFGAYRVVIECAGSEKPSRGHNRQPVVYILWVWNPAREDWEERARSASTGWEWTWDLRAPAVRALNPHPEFYDALERGRSLAGELFDAAMLKLEGEQKDVRLSAWNALYEQAIAQLTQCAR